jgi:uncharacterized iron-regulated membrane protein
MTNTKITITETEATNSVELIILLACLIIAAIAVLIGMLWLRRRRAAHRHEHLDAKIARPESLAEESRHNDGAR